MDATDEQLLALLRHDARRGISELAGTLGLSRATVRSRLRRLEETGVVLGYTVVLGVEAERPVRGVMTIEVEGIAADKVVRKLSGMAEVFAVHTTNGRWDLVVELGTGSLAEFDAVLRRVRQIPGIANTETNLLLATPRSTATSGR